MTQDKFWYLKQINLFEGIPEDELMKLANNVHEKSCNKKEILYTPFEPNDCIYILKKGEVTLYYSKNGKRLTIDVLKPGSIFGNIAFEEKANTHFAEVTEDAYICTFQIDEFMKILNLKPEIMIKFMKEMSSKISDYEKRIEFGLLDAKEKILKHLQILEEKKKNSFLYKLIGKKSKITHEQLAQHTGLSRETVTRTLKELEIVI